MKKGWLRHGVVAAASPGVAAQDAAQGEPRTLQHSMLGDGFHGILRASGGEAAGGREMRGDRSLVESYEEYEDAFHSQGSVLPESGMRAVWALWSRRRIFDSMRS